MRFLESFRRRLERLGPYASLGVLAIPLTVVEPFKLVAVLIAGAGHFFTGMFFLVCTYAVSLLVTEWMFVALKPKLMTLRWFAKSWLWFLALRRRSIRWLRSSWASAGRFLFGRWRVSRDSRIFAPSPPPGRRATRATPYRRF